MEQETTTPGRGSAESAAWFRDQLDAMGLTLSAFGRMLQRLGDDRQFLTILRSLSRMASGDARVSGEMRATLTYMQKIRRINGRRVASLERQLDSLLRGDIRRVFEDKGHGPVDTTAETIARLRANLQEMRDLPPELIGSDKEIYVDTEDAPGDGERG